MAYRNQTRIRRDFDRFTKLCTDNADKHSSLGFLAPDYVAMNDRVNTDWQGWGKAVRNGLLQRSERTLAQDGLTGWVQEWRPIILLKDPAAADSLQQMPADAPTHDDFVRISKDMKAYLENECRIEALRTAALEALGDRIETAEKETNEASQARRDELAARTRLTETMLEANKLLVRGLDVVRAVFGADSPQYRQFMLRETAEEQQEDDDNIFFDGQSDEEDAA